MLSIFLGLALSGIRFQRRVVSNVFQSTFTDVVFINVTFYYVFNVFILFERFLHLCNDPLQSSEPSALFF